MTDELSRLAALGWIAPEEADDGVRYVAASRDETISYPEEGFDLFRLEGGGSGFWFDHRAAAVRRHVESLGITSMWEIGAGTGAMANRLRDCGVEVVAVEPFAAGARASAGLGLTSLCGTLVELSLPDRSVESIGAFDVLEHLEHPAGMIAEMSRVLRPGGFVVATVPAFEMLWGDEDDVAGHHRRYRRSTLDMSFEERGFIRIRSEYLFASLVPAAAALRALPYRLGRRRSKHAVLQRMRKQLNVAPAADRFARAVLAAESWIASLVPLPFGLSALGVFQKP